MPDYGGDCPVAVVAWASWPQERIVRATLATIVDAMAKCPVERTAVILVGRVLDCDRFRDSALYDVDYPRRFRT